MNRLNLADINKDEFILRECQIANTDCLLVFPNHIGVQWTPNNLKYRSSMWNLTAYDALTENKPVSLGFRKFFNWGEHPELTPLPKKLDGDAIAKIDGSLLITSYHRGARIIRTRGTVDAISTMENGEEIRELISRYPKAFDSLGLRSGKFSVLYEWTSPTNKIVIDYGNKPEIYLVGIVDHHDYSYLRQDSLDRIAKDLGIKRPRRFHFKSFDEMLYTVQELKDEEGICYYYNAGQDILKVKSVWYLALHALKSHTNYENLLDLYFAAGHQNFNYDTIVDFISGNYDYEYLQFVQPMINRLDNIITGFRVEMDDLEEFVKSLTGTRKDKAIAIFNAYGKDSPMPSLAFRLLDGKRITDIDLKKIYLGLLKEAENE